MFLFLLQPYKDVFSFWPEVDITEYVTEEGMTSIKRPLDPNDNAFGSFPIGSFSFKVVNDRGTFDPESAQSLFPTRVEGSRIRVKYLDEDLGIDTELFDGFLSEVGVSGDFQDNSATFTALDSFGVLLYDEPSGSVLRDGMTLDEFFRLVLFFNKRFNAFGYSVGVLDFDYSFILENVQSLLGISSYEAIRRLLRASNSVAVIEDGVFQVRSRNYARGVRHELIGGGRSGLPGVPIERIFSFNKGFHRIFNSITVGEGRLYTDVDPSNAHFRNARVETSFVTTETVLDEIAQNLVDQFRIAKEEFKVAVPIQELSAFSIFDTFSVDHSTEAHAVDSAAHYNISKYDEARYPPERYTRVIQAYRRHAAMMKEFDLLNKSTIIKLRRFGKTLTDGNF